MANRGNGIDIYTGGNRPGGIPTHIVAAQKTNFNAPQNAVNFGPQVATVNPVGAIGRFFKRNLRRAAQ